MPRYRDAAYGGETVILENPHLRLEIHKRVTGWGWGELFVRGPDGAPDRFYAVMEHLAEADLAGQAHPLRLEADAYTFTESEGVQELTFEVALQQVAPPNQTFTGESALKGTVTLSLSHDESVLRYRLALQPQFLIYLRRIRGPWLRVGADSFGMARHDAIFPGIEWVIGDEWSSGTDWFEHPQALRVTPHPHKVAIPIMAISHDGVGLGLSWTPGLETPSSRPQLDCPQPVFASPNFVDRRPHHLLGLMWPSARSGLDENALAADPPIRARKGLKITLEAEIAVVAGTSMDLIVDWVQRKGLPDPGEPRYEWHEALERIMRAYNSNLWTEGQGWVYRGKPAPLVPRCVRRYIESGDNRELVHALERKVAWCDSQSYTPEPPNPLWGQDPFGRPLGYSLDGQWQARDSEEWLAIPDRLLEIQTPEGDLPFDPEGRHHTTLQDWAHRWRPLGLQGDSALDLCVTAAAALLMAGEKTAELKYADAARKALEFALHLPDRPEGGDWWETPLHSPNLLTAGHGAIAYYLGYKQFDDPRYLKQARYWLRCILPFTHLWEPYDTPKLYNTNPCLNSTCWFLSDWVSRHVQWEVLRTFAMSAGLGIDWAAIDPEIDWRTFQRGITTAVLRWMVDHDDPDWVFAADYDPQLIADGAWDAKFTDVYDPVRGAYGGMTISPSVIADNIAIILASETS